MSNKIKNKAIDVMPSNGVALPGMNEIIDRIYATKVKYDPKLSYTEFMNKIEKLVSYKFNFKKTYSPSLRKYMIHKIACTAPYMDEIHRYLINEVLAMEEYIHRQHITATILKLEPDTMRKLIEVTVKRYSKTMDIEPYDISPVANCTTRMLFPVNDHDLPQDIYPYGISVAFGDFENYKNETVLKQVLDYINDPENLYPLEEK